VAEGRAIYNNTKQFIRYLISSNIGEVVCILVTGLVGIPDALLPVQLLWVNLVTDGLPATALGFNTPDPDIMEQPPRRTDEPIVNGWLFFRYMVVGTYVGLATVGGFVWWFLSHGFTMSDLMNHATCIDMNDAKCAILADPKAARAVSLSILVVVEMFNALNALSENQSIVVTRPSSNKWLLLAIASSMFLHFAIMYVPQLAATFAIAPMGVSYEDALGAPAWSVLIPCNFDDWKLVFVCSIPVLFLDEGLKYISRVLGR
jgi:magnesium-transporting ATPase (P-type)